MVDLEDLAGLLDEGHMPQPPTMIEACKRAADSFTTKTRRQMVRPLKRGMWDVVTERIVSRPGEPERLSWTPNVRVTALDDDRFEVLAHGDLPHGPDLALADQIRAAIPLYQHLLSASDISQWLCQALDALEAVSLRERGGFYFLPAGDGVAEWDRLIEVLHKVSAHRVFALPAAHSDDVVEAVLRGLRAEATDELKRLEEYMAGDLSTKGLNSATRKLEALQKKLANYSALLGLELTAFTEQAEQLLGAVQAARLADNSKASNGALAAQ
jgi:hypothetical protein